MKTVFWVAVLSALMLTACQTAADHRKAIRDDDGEQLTIGKVQREIKVGMPSAQVASVLGSPNMVSVDENRMEVWVYDKVATERVYSASENEVSGEWDLGGLISKLTLGLAGSHKRSAGAASTTQRTLTVIIKFDGKGLVRDYSYHTSKF